MEQRRGNYLISLFFTDRIGNLSSPNNFSSDQKAFIEDINRRYKPFDDPTIYYARDRAEDVPSINKEARFDFDLSILMHKNGKAKYFKNLPEVEY